MRTPVFEPQGFAGTPHPTFGTPGRGAPELLSTNPRPVPPHFAPMAGAPPSTTATYVDSGASGYRARAPALRRVRWLTKFKPEMPPRYEGAADPSPFLLVYEEAVLEAGGDDKIMANWFPMALAGERAPGCSTSRDPQWLPGGNSVTSSSISTRCQRTTQSRPC